ncbi:MAG: peptidoglycan-binding protein [Patescibacteria group bacterium]
MRELRLGNTDIEVEHLQQVLFAEGELTQQKHITGYFGTITQTALKKFQARHKLPQTGITDAATRMKLSTVSGNQAMLSIPEDIELFTKDLRLGARNPEVEQLQQFLIYEGSYTNGTVNGVFDQATRSAVIAFQKKYNIKPPVGYVGYKTRHQIQFLSGL